MKLCSQDARVTCDALLKLDVNYLHFSQSHQPVSVFLLIVIKNSCLISQIRIKEVNEVKRELTLSTVQANCFRTRVQHLLRRIHWYISFEREYEIYDR